MAVKTIEAHLEVIRLPVVRAEQATYWAEFCTTAAVAVVADIWAGDLLTVVLVAAVAVVIITAARTAALLKTVQAAATHLMKVKQANLQHVAATAVQIPVAAQVVDNTVQTVELVL
jgi:hypothetical protein